LRPSRPRGLALSIPARSLDPAADPV